MTDDFRLYHRLVPFLEDHNVPVLGLAPGEDIPPAVQVILNGPPGDERSRHVLASREATLLSVLAALDERPSAREGYQRVVVGVDPGDVTGLALLADDRVLLVAEERDPAAAANRVHKWTRGISARLWEIHIGDGAPEATAATAQAMHSRVRDARIIVVPEEGTTPFSVETLSRHTDAAIMIARREA